MKGFTYGNGNGIVHSLAQDTRQLPQRSKDGTVTDLSYAYDENANWAGRKTARWATTARTV